MNWDIVFTIASVLALVASVAAFIDTTRGNYRTDRKLTLSGVLAPLVCCAAPFYIGLAALGATPIVTFTLVVGWVVMVGTAFAVPLAIGASIGVSLWVMLFTRERVRNTELWLWLIGGVAVVLSCVKVLFLS